MVDVAIIADDLTGALDAAAPFASRGRRVEAAVSREGLAEIDTAADVITVNVATRAESAECAASIVRDVTERIVSLRPRILFKKIDSTLRGHVAAELSAVLSASKRNHVVVCPAVPTQGRVVRSGALFVEAADHASVGSNTGHQIAPLFASVPAECDLRICDACDADDLNDVADFVLSHPAETIAVGAAGLADALADRLFGPAEPCTAQLAAPGLFVVGSRAPATQCQLQELKGDPRAVLVSIGLALSADGAHERATLIEILTPDGASIPADAAEAVVADRMAAASASRVEALAPGSLFLCGGHIAERVLASLATTRLSIVGELEPGVPVSRALIRSHQTDVVTKAGGFGDPGFLSRLADRVANAS